MRLYIVRHGQSVWNADGRIQGHAMVPLSDLGRQQAQRTAERLHGHGIMAIITSDLPRARETADLIAAEIRASVDETAALRERGFGVYQGMTFDEIAATYPDDWHNVFQTMDATAEGGETRRGVWTRVATWVDRLRAMPPAETVAIVSHGGPIRALLAHFLQMEGSTAWQFRVDNCSLTVVDCYDEGVIVNATNDTSHLTGLIDIGEVAW